MLVAAILFGILTNRGDNPMSVEQLKEVMKYHLKNFNDEGVMINDQTIHKDVLSANDGFGAANSKQIYKAVIRWTLKKEGHEDKQWPNNWMNFTVEDLAPMLI
jgi:hypothetical protein